MIALIDYGAGNLTSVRKALSAVGASFFTPASPADLPEAAGIIVPGVGHFSSAAVLQGGWREAVAQCVARGVPLFGICLGMQWLFDGSDEAPVVRGLGAIAGMVTRIDVRGGPVRERPVPIDHERRAYGVGVLKIPHVGWNTLEITGPTRILSGVPAGTYVYFTHSYAAPVTAETVAVTTHASVFAAAVETANVFGVQFHPEKSGDAGLRILRNFVELSCSPSA